MQNNNRNGRNFNRTTPQQMNNLYTLFGTYVAPQNTTNIGVPPQMQTIQQLAGQNFNQQQVLQYLAGLTAQNQTPDANVPPTSKGLTNG